MRRCGAGTISILLCVMGVISCLEMSQLCIPIDVLFPISTDISNTTAVFAHCGAPVLRDCPARCCVESPNREGPSPDFSGPALSITNGPLPTISPAPASAFPSVETQICRRQSRGSARRRVSIEYFATVHLASNAFAVAGLTSCCVSSVADHALRSHSLEEWTKDSSNRVLEHLAGYQQPIEANEYEYQLSMPSSSIGRPSSLAVTSRSRTTVRTSGSLPALSVGSLPTLPTLTDDGFSPISSVGSVDTAQASALIQQRVLHEEEDGLLVAPIPTIDPQADLLCLFPFLQCHERFDDYNSWVTHNIAHFRMAPVPSRATCPLCGEEFRDPAPRVAWCTMLEHVALHLQMGETLSNARPDFELFEYLHRRRIIGTAQYTALVQSDTHDGQSGAATEPYETSHNDRRSRRAHTRPRRQ